MPCECDKPRIIETEQNKEVLTEVYDKLDVIARSRPEDMSAFVTILK